MELFIGLTIPLAGTALGAALVFLIRDRISQLTNNAMLGFASGIMVAASFWSLLQPALEQTGEGLTDNWPVIAGFIAGMGFLLLLDTVIPHQHSDSNTPEGPKSSLSRSTKMILAVALHNIPEGLAVGVAFGALHANGYTTEALMGAMTIAIGIGLQNFPEGAAVALPLRREGYSRGRSFFWGQASGMVEPIAGVLGAAMVVYIEAILPFALAFAAGTMILVAVHELIPECQQNQDANPYFATMGIVCGFALMMVLDVALG